MFNAKITFHTLTFSFNFDHQVSAHRMVRGKDHGTRIEVEQCKHVVDIPKLCILPKAV